MAGNGKSATNHLFAAAAGLFGVVLNNLIEYTGLKETSQSYQDVSAAFTEVLWH